jgi:lysyl-tRNA synthetase class 2
MATVAWTPTARPETLRLRADLLARIRRFFADRNFLEVETPLLGAAAALDPHLSSFVVGHGGDADRELYLQTSPEFAMKRLLAAGSGPVYQICKAFREAESGRWHNPEFTLLEWYRPGFDYHRLMDEVDVLVCGILGTPAAVRITYDQVFQELAGLSPHDAHMGMLRRAAREQGLAEDVGAETDRDGLLDFLFTHTVQRGLVDRGAVFVYDFPTTQAALARVRAGNPPVAERFELLVQGVELANGYHELTDPAEQRRRFECDQARRRERALPAYPLDERLLAAIAHGMPSCAGVALGVDRLVMLAAGAGSIDEVIAFPISRA